jgi:hypothetical protein
MQKTLITYLFGLLCLVFISGCITKSGTSLNTGNLVRGPDGIWRLKSHTPKITEPVIEKIHPPAKVSPPIPKAVEFPPARVKPTPTQPKSAIPNPSPVVAKSSPAKLSPFEPTILPAKNVNVRPVTLPIEEKENVDNVAENTDNIQVKIDKGRLIMFYLIIFILLIVGWRGYLLYQKSKQTPKPKKAAKRRKSRKTATKAVKKQIQSKGKRASVLAAKKNAPKVNKKK